MPSIANLGYVGYAKFGKINSPVRVTSADLHLAQSVTKPDIIDGKTDKTVYILGPKIIEGGLSFPAVHDQATGVISSIWNMAVQRDADGRISNDDINVKYATGVSYKYTDCIINTLEMSVTQQATLDVTLNVMGKDRITGDTTEPSYSYRNTRAITWNDIIFGISSSSLNVAGSETRQFSININNDADRYYTFNRLLAPQDLAPRKREITGTMEIMGRNLGLANLALTNQNRCHEDGVIRFGYELGGLTSATGCAGSWVVEIPGCVFEIETLNLTNNLFVTTVNYHALPGITFGSEGRSTNFVVSS
ncbi:MAG: phage tail tube protein [Phenylobacterium sp.]